MSVNVIATKQALNQAVMKIIKNTLNVFINHDFLLPCNPLLTNRTARTHQKTEMASGDVLTSDSSKPPWTENYLVHAQQPYVL